MDATLQDYVASLEKPKQLKLAVKLLEIAMPIWLEFSDDVKNIEYGISAIGVFAEVDRQIMSRSILTTRQELVSGGSRSKEIEILSSEFTKHLAAIRDEDWIIPQPIELLIYAASNLLNELKGINTHSKSFIYITINQVADSILKSNLFTIDELNKKLAMFKETGN